MSGLPPVLPSAGGIVPKIIGIATHPRMQGTLFYHLRHFPPGEYHHHPEYKRPQQSVKASLVVKRQKQIT